MVQLRDGRMEFCFGTGVKMYEKVYEAGAMLSDNELLAIRIRTEKATKGPWKAFIEGRDFECGSSFIQTQGDDIEPTGATEADYDFIANARQDIPKLLDEIDRLRALIPDHS